MSRQPAALTPALTFTSAATAKYRLVVSRNTKSSRVSRSRRCANSCSSTTSLRQRGANGVRTGKISMASSGNGSALHVSGELFKLMTDVNMVHVPYRGGAPALTDLLGGQVQVMFATMPSAIG
jgi:hypothetical protein